MHSASLAYYTLFALIPIIYLAINIFGRIVGNEVVRATVASFLQEYIGITDISGIMDFLKTVDVEHGNPLLEVVGICALLFSCSAFLISLKRSINDFFDIQRQQVNRRKLIISNLLFRLVAILIIAVFGVVIITVYLSETVLMSFGKDFFENETLEYIYVYLLGHAMAILTNFLVFSCIFKFVHDGKVRWRLAMAGALVTGISLYLGQLVIKYYLGNFFFASKGGFAGSFFVILAWVYYSSQIIFLGAKFTAVYARMVDQPIRVKFKTQEELENTIL